MTAPSLSALLTSFAAASSCWHYVTWIKFHSCLLLITTTHVLQRMLVHVQLHGLNNQSWTQFLHNKACFECYASCSVHISFLARNATCQRKEEDKLVHCVYFRFFTIRISNCVRLCRGFKSASFHEHMSLSLIGFIIFLWAFIST